MISVFLHTSPEMPIPDIQQSEVASAHWVPLSCCKATRPALRAAIADPLSFLQCYRLMSVGETFE